MEDMNHSGGIEQEFLQEGPNYDELDQMID